MRSVARALESNLTRHGSMDFENELCEDLLSPTSVDDKVEKETEEDNEKTKESEDKG